MNQTMMNQLKKNINLMKTKRLKTSSKNIIPNEVPEFTDSDPDYLPNSLSDLKFKSKKLKKIRAFHHRQCHTIVKPVASISVKSVLSVASKNVKSVASTGVIPNHLKELPIEALNLLTWSR